jgi:Ran GTPase-activating protein (RanGAP) involved in mRNA processing and transport
MCVDAAIVTLVTLVESLPEIYCSTIIPAGFAFIASATSRAMKAAMASKPFPVHLVQSLAVPSAPLSVPPLPDAERFLMDLRALMTRFAITGLDFSKNCGRSGCQMRALADVLRLTSSSLVHLNLKMALTNNKVRWDDELSALARCTRLETLDLSHNNMLRHYGEWQQTVDALANMRQLRTLNISSINLWPQQVQELAEVLPKLGSLERLCMRYTLQKGPVAPPRTSHEALGAALGTLTKLQYLNLGHAYPGSVARLALGLRRLTALTYLNLKHCGLGALEGDGSWVAEGEGTVRGALAGLTRLQVLVLKMNELQSAGGDALGCILPRYPALTQLHLAFCGLGTGGDLGWLAAGLPLAGALRCLNLNSNPLRARGAEQLWLALMACTSLTRLRISSCGLKDAGVCHIAHALMGHPRLTVLDLRNNKMAALSAAQVGNLLGHNTSLTHLWLGYNQMRTVAFQGFAQHLPRFRALRFLDLQGMGLTDEGAAGLADVLSGCPALEEVRLRDNPIGGHGEDVLRDAVAGTRLELHEPDSPREEGGGANGLRLVLRDPEARHGGGWVGGALGLVRRNAQ